MQIVGIRNGFIGTAPVLWPDTSGNYNGTRPVFERPRPAEVSDFSRRLLLACNRLAFF